MFNAARQEIIREKLLTGPRLVSPPKANASPAPDLALSHIAVVGSFPPRRCGIATFTADLEAELSTAPLRCDIVAISEGEGDENARVRHVIRQHVLEDYVRAAERLNAEGIELVCVQHEFGIFGGDAGDHLLAFLDTLACPVVVTLHTVLPQPNNDQSRVMAALLRRAARVIVMAERGRRMLMELYNAPADKVVVLPHGAPDYPFVDPDQCKARFALEGRDVLLTFGLLSPNKGIESVIRALPQVITARPNTTYVVLGATHPHLVRRDGEAYRDSLIKLAEELGVGDHVLFVNKYVEDGELHAYLAAADVYVTPYLNEAQITSGTLSFAVALGKPVVSTPYWHAQELLADDVGILVPFNASGAFGDVLVDLLSDKQKRESYRARAYEKGRETIWPRSGQHYLDLFEQVAPHPKSIERRRALVEAPSMAAIERMSDQCGMLQHARFGVPDRAHGYCVDDNARALILMMRGGGADLRRRDADRLLHTYAAFVDHAWNPDRGRFRNFMSYDRRWLEEAGSEDSFGRSLWSVGETAALARDAELRDWALSLGGKVVPLVGEVHSLRATAFCILGLRGLIAAKPDDAAAHQTLARCADVLRRKLAESRKPGWIWFEPGLGYDNARLCEALIVAGGVLDDEALVKAGLESLTWLTAMQTSVSGAFVPVGNATFGKHYITPAVFDQQPVEAVAMIDACWAAYDASGESVWEDEAHRAYAWFFGRNVSGAMIATAKGGCYDGLEEAGVNRNQGAESLLSLQLANVAMKARDRGRRPTTAR